LTEYNYFEGTGTTSKAHLLLSPGDRETGVWERNKCTVSGSCVRTGKEMGMT